MAETQRNQPTEFQVELPGDAESGRYADFARIWHTDNSFVLDFAALKGPAYDTEDPDTGAGKRVVPATVVSRIRIPPQQVFELAKALTHELELWERQTGADQSGSV